MKGRKNVPDDEFARYFWSRVVRTVGCWLWLGAGSRYGTISRHGKTRLVHRVAYELATGINVPTGAIVGHHCDRPLCVNPDHLFSGSQADNIRDCVRKGRHFIQIHPECVPSGEENGRHKLTASDVRQIRVRHAHGESYRGLAREYGVGHTSVRCAVLRQTWRNIA